MPSYVTPKKNVAFVMFISLVSQANTKIMQGTPTLAAADFNVSGDGGALGALGTTPTVTPAASKMVKVSLSAAEMNFDNVTLVCSDNAGAEWCDLVVNIQTSARQVDDLAWPATTGRSMVVDAAGLVDANTVKLGPTGAGTAQTARDVGAQLDAAVTTRLAPTVAARTLDVSATGEAGLDWANVGSPTTANALTGTTIAVTQKVDVDTIKTNPVVNAGTITFPTTATLASTTNITAGTVTTATNLTTNNDKTGYALSATGSAAMTEDYAADGATGTLNQILYHIQQSLDEFAISGTTRTVKKLDGSTTAMTFTLDSSTAPTSTTRAT